MPDGQARWHAGLAVLGFVGLLTGCDPLQKPIDLFHGLEGGEIAAERPPPPGAGQPYPHVGTVPEKPVLPTAGFRTALYSQLAAERDQKALLAAGLPREVVPPPPGGTSAAKPSSSSSATDAPSSTPATSGAPAPEGADASATNATIDAANAPPAAALPASAAAPAAPPHDAALQIAGDPVDTSNLPLVPDAPPPPAGFEDVAAQPVPSARVLPAPSALPAGKMIYFASGSYVLQASQRETLDDVAGHRGKGVIDIIGLGEADTDAPLGQEAAIDLGLRRARAVAVALSALHVPGNAVRISARAFGRGALVRDLP